MAYRAKEKSPAIEAAQVRLAAMAEIDKAEGKAVSYGMIEVEPEKEGDPNETALTTAYLTARVEKMMATMEEYNSTLAKATGLKNDYEDLEVEVKRLTSSVLAGGKARFGPDHSYIEQLGGTRSRDRSREARAGGAAAKGKSKTNTPVSS